MTSTRSALLLTIACIALVTSCSSSPSSGTDAAPPLDSTVADAGGSPDVGSDAPAAADAGSDASASPCPSEQGSYAVVTMGAGCGDLASSAPECITQTACAITLTSAGTVGDALNGSADLAMDGSFSGAAIREGTVDRTGCVGTWDATASTLTIDCGGVGSSQSCRAVLTRLPSSC